MKRLNIKPLTVNQAYRGRRFKSAAYIQYGEDLVYLLPKMIVPSGKLRLSIIAGFSSTRSDADNIVKPFQDILSQAYGFNDNLIYKLDVEKRDVKKGEEYLEFNLTSI